MPDTLSRNIYRDLFSDDQWDLIYSMAGHALDNDDFTPEDVYSIRNKIHTLFDEEWKLLKSSAFITLTFPTKLIWNDTFNS